MGTAQEWFRVFVAGSLFGGLMGFVGWMQSRHTFVQIPRIYLKLTILYYALGGFCFGIVDTFTTRAFRPPLVFLNIAIIACLILVGWFLRRFARTLPRLPKKLALFPVPDFGRAEKKSDANNAN